MEPQLSSNIKEDSTNEGRAKGPAREQENGKVGNVSLMQQTHNVSSDWLGHTDETIHQTFEENRCRLRRAHGLTEGRVVHHYQGMVLWQYPRAGETSSWVG
jgi:hypothetical protein